MTVNLSVSKQDFAAFVATHRRGVGLTQRELALRLHVTESAVSKWERGLSYPDITLIPRLAEALAVRTDELIAASENLEDRAARREARSYRRWRAALLWTSGLAYLVALLACFIINLSVEHSLSWFWIVFAALACAASLTTLPLLAVPRRGWLVLGAATFSFLALLTAIALQHQGGAWVPITVAATLTALIVVMLPIALYRARATLPFGRHVAVVSLAIDTVAIAVLLLVVLLSLGRGELWFPRALVLAAIGLVPVWGTVLVIRYGPGNGLLRAGLATSWLAVASYWLQPAIALVLGEQPPGLADLTRWTEAEYVEANIQLLIAGVLLAAGILLGIAGAVRKTRRAAVVPAG